MLALSGCSRPPVPGQPIDRSSVIGGLGDTPGKFAYPRAIDPSIDGRSLWVIDRSARVQRIDPHSGRCTTLWKMPDSELGKPVGFSVAPGYGKDGGWENELLYVADTHYHRVMIYKPPQLDPEPDTGHGTATPKGEPELIRRFGEYGQGPGQFVFPTDVAVLLGPDGHTVERLYVSEYGGHDRVSVFDGKLSFLFEFGAWGDAKGRPSTDVVFMRPQSLSIETIDGQKQLIVTDSANHRLGRFDLDGKLLGWYGSPETMGDGVNGAPARFRFPYGLASLGDGTVLVSEFGGNRVQRIDLRTGNSLGSWGQAGREQGQLIAPWAVAVLGKETFIVDSGNNRLVTFATPR